MHQTHRTIHTLDAAARRVQSLTSHPEPWEAIHAYVADHSRSHDSDLPHPLLVSNLSSSIRSLTQTNVLRDVRSMETDANDSCQSVIRFDGRVSTIRRILMCAIAHSNRSGVNVEFETPHSMQQYVQNEHARKHSMALGVHLTIAYDDESIEFARRHPRQNFRVLIPANTTSVELDAPNVTRVELDAPNGNNIRDVRLSGLAIECVSDRMFINATHAALTDLKRLRMVGAFAFASARNTIVLDDLPELRYIKLYAFRDAQCATLSRLDRLRRIGAGAFYNSACAIVLDRLPNLEQIDEHAFASALSVTLGALDMLRWVHKYAFKSSRSAVVLRGYPRLYSIGMGAFENASQVRIENLPQLQYIATSAFRCALHATLTDVKELVEIHEYAFASARNHIVLKRMPRLAHIQGHAFLNASAATLTDLRDLEEIGPYAFGYAMHATLRDLPALRRVDPTAFHQAHTLTLGNVGMAPGDLAHAFVNLLTVRVVDASHVPYAQQFVEAVNRMKHSLRGSTHTQARPNVTTNARLELLGNLTDWM